MNWTKSEQFYKRARAVMPSGVSSAFRSRQKPVPLFIDRGYGACLYDVDGNEYFDYALGHGPLVLGHCHPAIVRAVEKQLARGSTFGCQHELEAEVAEKMLAVLPWAERVLFSNTGTEAVQVALRLARAATGRKIVVKFEGDYHGWMDSILVGYRHKSPVQQACNSEEMLATMGQSSSVLEDIRVLPWNDAEAIERCFREIGSEIAAVITEPMQCNVASVVPAPGFLEAVRAETQKCGALLIFDEVITGFRLAPGGGSEYFGVAPDLAVFGKALAGGYPLSAVAGKADLMEAVEAGQVMHAGTFNGNPIAMAAAAATLGVLFRPGGNAFLRLQQLGEQLWLGLQRLGRARTPVVIQGVPTCFHMLFQENPICNYRDFVAYDMRRNERWVEAALREGIFQMADGRWYVSLAHSDEVIGQTLERAERAFDSFCRGGEA
jgi:glutamate-1-semialdehyde 2,1-aminomutase